MTADTSLAPRGLAPRPDARLGPRRGVFDPTGPVEVVVLVVTYNSADDLGALLDDLRAEASRRALRVVVADNASTDATWEVASGHPDVVAVRTGGNLGYAAGLNAAMRHAGPAAAVLVLNPDLRLPPRALDPMLARLRDDERIGIVVPRIDEPDGTLHHSLRREPGVVRAASDALLGRAWPARPGVLSEHIRDDRAYRAARPVEWATGAALLIRSEAARDIGAWDERFFLYSEETDFQRRAREAGWTIWLEPAARVVHRGGGSGVSNDLVALTVVNRVRYAEKHLPGRAALFRAAVMLGEELRRDPTHARARWALRRRARWRHLPRAVPDEAAPASPAEPAVTPGTTVDHVLVTRFNLPTPGPESLVRAREGWLRERIDLFERHTVPSVLRQRAAGLSWIVYLDPLSPTWLLERLQPHIAAGVFMPLYREHADWTDVARDARGMTGARGDLLLTTNLDNDDALADDFAVRVQALARRHGRSAIYLASGLIARGDELYLRRDARNAFCSVAEPWDDPGTAWRDWHTLLGRHYPVVVERGAPGWMQVVHGGNVSNRVRGRLTSPAPWTHLFGAELRDRPIPRLRSVIADRVALGPLRAGRELARSIAKNVVLKVFGKATVDRVKARLSAKRT